MRTFIRTASLGLLAVCLIHLSALAQFSYSRSNVSSQPIAASKASVALGTKQRVESLQRLTQAGYYSTLVAARQQPKKSASARMATSSCNSYLCSAISPTLSVSLTSSGPLTCTATSVTLIATGNPATGVSYAFAGPDGVVSSSGSTAVVTKAGDYTVTLSASGAQSATAVTTVQSNTALTATITGNLTVCAGSTTDLTASGGDTFRWNTGATTATVSVTSGTYSVTASRGSCQATASISVSLCIPANTPPVAVANASQTATIGQLFSYTVNAFTDVETANSLTYTASLNPASGLTFDPVTRIVAGTPTQQGVVSVTVTASDAGGLSTSTSFSITVQPAPVAPLALTVRASSMTLLTTGTTTLSASVSGGMLPYRYLFTGPGTIVSNGNTASVSNLPAGVQTFTVVVSDAVSPISQTISGIISVTVSLVNTAPRLVSAIPPQSATVGQGFNYIIPANTFTDTETPSSLILSVVSLPPGLSFVAPATITGTPSTTVGSPFTATVRVTDPGGLSASTTVSISVRPVPVATTLLRVLHQDADNNLTNNAIKPTIQLVNDGTTSIIIGRVTVRYWLTAEQFAPMTNLSVYYAQLGSGKVKMKYVALDKPRQGALGYVEYSFDATAGMLAAGANTGPIQSGIAKQDWTPFQEADDYSYANNRNLTANERITAYLNGSLVWGVEPVEEAVQQRLKVYTENKSGTSTNSISTFLQVQNEGNVPVRYSDLKVRYYLTSEGNQALNFYLDYAVLGNGKVKGQMVRLNPSLNKADAYLELSFDALLGNLNPTSNTGNIQYRIAKQDWSNFNQSNDHSYQNGSNPMAENNKVVVYLAGQRVYGTEPGATARQAVEESTEALNVQVLGNPTTNAWVDITIDGVGTEPVTVRVVGQQGQLLDQQLYLPPTSTQLVKSRVPLGAAAGTYFLQATTPTRSTTVKVVRQ